MDEKKQVVYRFQIPDLSASLEVRTDYIAERLSEGPSPEYGDLCDVLDDIYSEMDRIGLL